MVSHILDPLQWHGIIFCIWYYYYLLSPLSEPLAFSPRFTAPSANKHVYKASPTTHREKRDRPIPGGWDFSDTISSPDVSHQFPVHRADLRLSCPALPPTHYHKLQETQNLLSVQQLHLFTYVLHTYTCLYDNVPRINISWYDNDDHFNTRKTIYSCTPQVGLHDR